MRIGKQSPAGRGPCWFERRKHPHDLCCRAFELTWTTNRAEITSAAPVYFPAKRLGSSTSSYYDGLEIPLLHARSEALRLCPRKTVPDYILSAGNGVMKATPNGMSNSLSRFAHFSLESLWGYRQYQRLGGPAGEAFNEFRIDPTLDMEAVALDDADAIGKLIGQLDREFLVNEDLHHRVQQISLVMIASLFYFSFDTTTRTTRRAGNEYEIAADERTVVSLTLPSWSVPFDIRL
ncbi:hypothetical protein CABS01_17267, partial [Colletotrichum abscissum]|uniref:uncharacterized protein n=1 Tax=Colletotrichum abscissum TaxID=1671311 RepID=UPI0027D5CAB2